MMIHNVPHPPPAAEVSSHLAHHFDDLEQQYQAANLGMWIFLGTEVLFFGGLFAAYTVYRWMYPGVFSEGSRHMDVPLGTANTGILLASSLLVALSVHAAQTGARRKLVALLLGTIVLGSMFLGIKAYEYHHHALENLVPGPTFHLKHLEHEEVDPRKVEMFFCLYFAMTGLHALHMVIGIGIFSVITGLAWRGEFSPEYHTPVEIGGLYWHFVDVVWVFLYPLFYLVS